MREANSVRLVVNRSNKNIYAQIVMPGISDTVVASASTVEKQSDKKSEKKSKSTAVNITTASQIGKLVAQRAIKKGISKVTLDRSGFKYHGRIKALADAAREEGLKF